MGELKSTIAGVLNCSYYDAGPSDGPVVFLMHGFPYAPQVYQSVVPQLVKAGCRVITPYLRGYGPTQFVSEGTLRSGEQAALGADLLALMDALGVERAILTGYDWGGRAACIVSALWPQRVIGLVTGEGYNIQNIAVADTPAHPEAELRYWYQYYFHSERGRRGLTQNRHEVGRLLWQLWSPKWTFDEEIYRRCAKAYNNKDYVDVVIHSYRHRYALVDGDPAYTDIETQLAAQPVIEVPALGLFGGANGVAGPCSEHLDRAKFSERYDARVVANVGHNIPLEAPEAFAGAALELLERDRN